MKVISQHTGLISDTEIIQKIIEGDTAVFEMLIRRYNPVLYKIARSFGFNHQDAEDLMQDAHVSAWLQLKDFEHRAAYKTWLSRIMVNKCLYKLRYGYFKKEVPGSEQINENTKPFMMSQNNSTTTDLAKKELSRIIEYSLQQLPLTYRTVFVLREIEGFKVAETAELLNISAVNVKVRLNRAKAMLQKELERVYTSAELYEFNLIYCDGMVKRVFDQIHSLQNK